MSENEKRLREWLKQYGERGLLVEAPEGILDALLSERRAEVEMVTAERDEWKRKALERDLEVTRLSAARDAALEEARTALAGHRDGASALRLFGRSQVFADAVEAVGALKSQPARQYLDAEKVRDVLATHYANTKSFVVSLVARDIGVVLDANGDDDALARGEANQTYWTGASTGRAVLPGVRAADDTRHTCTCLGACRGASGLGEGWRCALETTP